METINFSSSDERTFSILCHISALSGLVIPFGHIIGPLVFWLIKKDEYPEVDRQGKAALNFQISLTIYAIIAALLIVILIGFVLLALIGIFGIVMSIVAAVKTSNGARFSYPLSINIIS